MPPTNIWDRMPCRTPSPIWDFHLGGTNAKGYIAGAALGIAHNVNISARWLSSSEVSGPPYAVDVVLVDLNARF